MMHERRLSHARILVVDDERANVTLLERHLARAGFTNVLGVTQSASVVALAERENPDLILLDLRMPAPDGLQIMAQLRPRIEQELLPVLVLTGDDSSETKEAALSGGARDFLTKPFDWTEVYLRIRNLLEIRFLYQETQEQNVLLEEQLQHAQRMEVVGRLTGGIAHDFNNLLTIINGNAGLLLMDLAEADEQIREELEEIKGAAGRAAGLTRHLLGFSRQRRVDPSVVDINGCVDEMRRMLSRVLGGGVTLSLDLHPSAGRVLIDGGQLQQVILNLAINARDAMPRGGSLHFETRNVVFTEEDRRQLPYLVPGAYVQLRVVDTGIGMDASTLARLFTPYFTTKEEGKGTGLGLSIVYGIAKQNHGYVWAESEEEVGTTFTFSLPRVSEGAVARPNEVEPVEVQHGSGTVLVIERDEAVRWLMQKVLLRSGYRVIEAHDAQEAQQFCSEYSGRIDLTIADLTLPEVRDGSMAERLLSSRPETRILLTSGFADDDVVRGEGWDGRITFLRKPFAAETLVHSVRELVDGE